jgi:archaellum component FlaC
LETVNEFTKDRREHIESIDNEIKQVKEKITNVKQGWISYLESLEKSLLENVLGQKSKVVENIQKEIFETKQIEQYITNHICNFLFHLFYLVINTFNVFSSIFSKFIDCFQYLFYELCGIYER